MLVNDLTSSQVRCFRYSDILDDIHEEIESRTMTATELTLRNIWADILHKDPATIYLQSGFIKMGRDSVLAMRLSEQARASSVNLTVQQIF
jgi:aryl carrier-like protein